MSDPKLISPLLDGYAMGGPISDHHGVRCCPAMHLESEDKYIVKVLSIPASQVQVDALLLSGAFQDRTSVLAYFRDLADGVVSEAEILKKLTNLEGFSSYDNWQVVPKEDETGFDVYLIGTYKPSLEKLFRKTAFTHLNAVNMALDLCAALAVCRRAGYLYVDLKPSNVFLPDDQGYRIGDLGFIPMASLKYASLPERCRSSYTAPEVKDAYSSLNKTIDIYAVGLILYQAYNNGQLPFTGNAPGEALPAPMYADYEMSEIILKACDPDPAMRWKNPIEMGQAIVSYMQRNGVNDTPIVPAAVPVQDPAAEAKGVFETKPEEAVPEEEESAAAEDAEEASAENKDADIPAAPAECEETADNAENTEAADEAEETTSEPDSDQDELAFIKEMVSDETTPTDDNTQDLTDTALTEEGSDILAQADDLIAMPSLEPVVAPEPIEIPIPAPIVLSEETQENIDQEPAVDSELPDLAESEAADDSDPDFMIIEDETDAEVPKEAADDEEEEGYAPEDANKKNPLLGWIAALVVIAAVVFGARFYYLNYYLQKVEELVISGTQDAFTVSVKSAIPDSQLTVVCTDTYGNVKREALTGSKAVFTDLTPATYYKVQLEISGFHELVGETTGTYATAAQTNIAAFSAITGAENGSVILSFTVDGSEPSEWGVEYEAEGEQTRSVAFTGHSVTINGLTVGKTYTFRLVTSTDMVLVGSTTLQYDATEVIYAQELAISAVDENSLTVTWTVPEGAEVDSWLVRCYNESGYDQSQTVSEPGAVFTDIDTSTANTVEVTAAGMTQNSRTSITANPVTIHQVEIDTSNPLKVTIHWDYTGKEPEDGWLLIYSVEEEGIKEVIACDTNEAFIEPAIPGAQYDVAIQTTGGNTLYGGEASAKFPAAKTFVGYWVRDYAMDFAMCRTPQKENWGVKDVKKSEFTTTFAPGEAASFLVHLEWQYQVSDDDIVTLFIVRDEEGKLVSMNTQTRTWRKMWSGGYCGLDMPEMPTQSGKYTVEIYFNGMSVTTESFTIS